MTGGTFSDWSPYTSYVQSGKVDGQYATGAHMLLAAGPPRLMNLGGAAALAQSLGGGGRGANQIVYPMGLVQSFSQSENRNFARIFELGSERSYFIGGRTVGQIGISQVYYHGPSLLRTLYAYYQDLLPPTLVPAVFPNAGAASMSNPHDVVIPPGYENFFHNLASDLFAQPIGLMAYQRDVNQKTLGAMYFEACVVPQKSLSVDAQGVLIQEQASLQYERMVPVQVAALTLLSTTSTGNATGANVTFPGLVG